MLFPSDIELCRTGYSRNLKGEPPPQTFDAYIRQRRQVRRRGVTDTVTFICTDDQRQRLEQFHRDQGGDHFEINLPDYASQTSRTVARFDTPLTVKPVADHYEITASLYIPQPAVVPADELDEWLLSGMGIDGPGFEVLLHTVVHTDMPLLNRSL